MGASTLEDLTDIVVNDALPVLGADGGAVLVLQDDGSMRLAISDQLGAQTQTTYSTWPRTTRSRPATSPAPASACSCPHSDPVWTSLRAWRRCTR